MAEKMDWIIIENFGKQIGAIGFIGDKAAVVVSFYDDNDGNQDGKVSWGEWLAAKISPVGLTGKATVEVAMAARVEMDVIMRDPTFGSMAMNMYLNFAKGLIADGIYAAYFSRGVSAIAKPMAGRIATNIVAQFVVRKGMESAVKAAYQGVVK